MAGRPMNRLHQEDVRKKIQASQLLNVLHDHALGKTEELSQSRLKAIEILLRKSLPDLSSVEVVGDPENPVHSVARIELVALGNGADRTAS